MNDIGSHIGRDQFAESDDNSLLIRRKKRRIIGIAALLAAIVAGYYYFQNDAASPSKDVSARPALTVTAVRPQRVSWPDTVTATGVIAPWQEASIGTQIGNYQLIDVRVNVGDRVTRGQVLARLNPALLQAEEMQLRARYEQALANDQRARGLQQVGGISDQEALGFATEARTAKAVLDGKRLELRYTSILAPDNGVISARLATLGSVVPAGQELFRMIRQNRLEWRGEFTSAQLQSVASGQRVTLQLPDKSISTAIVRKTAPLMDAQSRLAIVYADLAPGGNAQAGMYVTGEIGVGQSEAIVVPATSVVIRDGRNYVFVIAKGSAATKVGLRSVTPGRRKASAIEVLEGLSGSEFVVGKGASFLNDGDVVRVADGQKAKP